MKCQASSVLVKSDKEPDEQAEDCEDEEDEDASQQVHDMIMINDVNARILCASYFEVLHFT